jgi:hypothetical protein
MLEHEGHILARPDAHVEDERNGHLAHPHMGERGMRVSPVISGITRVNSSTKQ